MQSSVPALRILLLAVLAVGTASIAAAAEPIKPAGLHLTEAGMFITRGPDGKWEGVAKDAKLPADQLLLSVPGAALSSVNKAVRVNMYGNLDGHSPLPIIETAVILGTNPKADLSLTLDRGRIDLTNVKAKGSATVEVKFRDEDWFITLDEPGTRVAIVLEGRWLGGDYFDPTGKNKKVPRTEVIGLVIQGEAHILADNSEFRLTAPPGPAEFSWSSGGGHVPTPIRVKELPDWAKVETADSPEVKARKAVIEEYRKLRVEKGLEAALQELLTSDDPIKKRMAIYSLAATDNLPAISKALRELRDKELWDHVVTALHHWLGRGPGQDEKFYKYLTVDLKIPEAQAETFMHLLHDPGPEERREPETYELLIDELDHEVVGIRALAHWHLIRLVPEGKSIPFDPYGKPEELAKAHAAWKKLIPAGSLPKKK